MQLERDRGSKHQGASSINPYTSTSQRASKPCTRRGCCKIFRARLQTSLSVCLSDCMSIPLELEWNQWNQQPPTAAACCCYHGPACFACLWLPRPCAYFRCLDRTKIERYQMLSVYLLLLLLKIYLSQIYIWLLST